jgi:hypothetical protein
MRATNLWKIQHKRLLIAAASLMLIFAIFSSALPTQHAYAQTTISSAQNTIQNCYKAAKEAEAAGANITVLTNTLNEAGVLLSKAELYYSQGDFAAANNYAAQCQNKLNNFISQAENLKQTARQHENRNFLINVVGSIAGAFAILGAGLAAWVILKRKYEKVGASSVESLSRV